MQKSAGKNTKYSRNETILNIGHLAKNILVENATLNFHLWMVEDQQLWAAVALGRVCMSCTRAYDVTSNAIPSIFGRDLMHIPTTSPQLRKTRLII